MRNMKPVWCHRLIYLNTYLNSSNKSYFSVDISSITISPVYKPFISLIMLIVVVVF
jgi:hypothetical protein